MHRKEAEKKNKKLNSSDFIRMPEGRRKQQNNRVHFQTACNHQHGQNEQGEPVEHAEIAGCAHLTQAHAGIGEDAQHCTDGSLHIQIVYGEQNTACDEYAEVQQDMHGDGGSQRCRDRTAFQHDRLHRMRVDSAEDTAFHQLQHDDDPDNLQGAGGGCRTAADNHEEKQNYMRESRPVHIVTHIIAGCGHHGNHLAQTVFYGLPEAGIGPAAFQND